MIPVHELLNRIRWDPEFAKGNFELGYYDRAANRIILVPLKEVTFFSRTVRRPFSSPTSKVRSIAFPFTACARFIRTRNAFGIGARPRHILNVPVSESYRVFVLEQLGRVASVSAKSMFGGVGLHAESLFFALIAEDRLYFKVELGYLVSH